MVRLLARSTYRGFLLLAVLGCRGTPGRPRESSGARTEGVGSVANGSGTPLCLTMSETVAPLEITVGGETGSTEDRTINPDLQRFMAKRMAAKTIEVKASHVSLISQPETIANLILEAAA